MVHSDVIWIDVFEVETGEKVLKAMVLNGALIRCLKGCLEPQKEQYQ